MDFLKKSIFSTVFIAVLVVLFIFTSRTAHAQSGADLSDTYYRAKVVKILEVGEKEVEEGLVLKYQKLDLEIISGDEKGKGINIDHGGSFVVAENQMVKEGEKVVIAKTPELPGGRSVYYIIDKYRVDSLLVIIVSFFALAIYFGRKRGFTAIVGLIFSVLVIFYYIIPSILKGADPFLTCILGGVVILVLSLYLSHGFNKRTSIALLSSIISLAFAIIIDVVFVRMAKLAGNGTEEAFYLQFDTFNFNLQGILLGGIIIGVLGVLDDITTAQVASIEEISLANHSLGFSQLYKSGLSIGREHIASLINTLVLAYVGVSFPFLILYVSQKTQAFWMTFNSSFVAEEIVRTLVGSATLVLAVPITTILAAWFYSRRKS